MRNRQPPQDSELERPPPSGTRSLVAWRAALPEQHMPIKAASHAYEAELKRTGAGRQAGGACHLAAAALLPSCHFHRCSFSWFTHLPQQNVPSWVTFYQIECDNTRQPILTAGSSAVLNGDDASFQTSFAIWEIMKMTLVGITLFCLTVCMDCRKTLHVSVPRLNIHRS